MSVDVTPAMSYTLFMLLLVELCSCEDQAPIFLWYDF